MTPAPESVTPDQITYTREPHDPYANKAIVSAIGAVVLVGARWAVSGELNLDDEGIVALAGAVTTLLVYAVSNLDKLRHSLRRG